VLLAINGVPVSGRKLEDGKDAIEMLDDATNYPLNLKFGRPKMTINEKIFLASMFYQLFAIASQLSPEPRSSGIETLEADTFKLQCFQTLTGNEYNFLIISLLIYQFHILGVKFMVIADPTYIGLEQLLKKIYEIYADFALKNPFYSLEMPIRCELFDTNLQALLEQADKNGINSI